MDLPLTFTIPELATMMRSDRRTVRRMLERHGVPISGERYGFVWLAHLAALPGFKESLELRAKAAAAAANDNDDQNDDSEEPRASSRGIARPRRAPARDW